MKITCIQYSIKLQLFREHRRNSEQVDYMPQFTKLGYKKMKMPKKLHQVGNSNCNLTISKKERTTKTKLNINDKHSICTKHC